MTYFMSMSLFGTRDIVWSVITIQAIPPMVEALRSILTSQDEDAVAIAFEVFDELAASEQYATTNTGTVFVVFVLFPFFLIAPLSLGLYHSSTHSPT